MGNPIQLIPGSSGMVKNFNNIKKAAQEHISHPEKINMNLKGTAIEKFVNTAKQSSEKYVQNNPNDINARAYLGQLNQIGK